MNNNIRGINLQIFSNTEVQKKDMVNIPSTTGNEREKTIEICETEEDRGTKMAKKVEDTIIGSNENGE